MRAPDAADRRARACVVAGGLTLTLGLILPRVAEASLGAAFPVRLSVAFALCASLGIALGRPFPAGVRAAARSGVDSVPFLWGVNGVASVVGSVLAAMLGKPLGSSRVVLLGGVVYLVAAALTALPARRVERARAV